MLGVRSPKGLGCTRAETDCCLRGLKKLFRDECCPDCTLTADDLIPERVQQKLVDTMLAADLLHLSAGGGEEPVALVTSDDDLMPPVIQAVHGGATVLHLHTIATRRTPTHYVPSAGGTYLEVAL